MRVRGVTAASMAGTSQARPFSSGTSVKGTAFDQGQATLEAGTIANAFWDLYQARTANFTKI